MDIKDVKVGETYVWKDPKTGEKQVVSVVGTSPFKVSDSSSSKAPDNAPGPKPRPGDARVKVEADGKTFKVRVAELEPSADDG